MKRMTLKLGLLTAAALLSALPAWAGQDMGGSMDQQRQGQKDECLLMAKNCGDNMDTIQQRIGRIQHEIKKGNSVYTDRELKQLKNQLEDANQMLEVLTVGGGA